MAARLKGFAPFLLATMALVFYSCSSSSCPPLSLAPAAPVASVPPVLQPRYLADMTGAPFHRVRDSLGDTIHVYAETLYFDTVARKYTEAARVGRFVGFAAESIRVERITGLTYTLVSPDITLPSALSGPGTGKIYGSTSLSLTFGLPPTGPAKAYWYFFAR